MASKNTIEQVEENKQVKPKGRFFTFLLYPESLPEDWELQLEM